MFKKIELKFIKKIFLIIFLINSCDYPELSRDELVYNNDFEGNKFEEIDGLITSFFNGSTVIGNFNNDGFTIHLKDIGEHHYIFISFANSKIVISSGFPMFTGFV